MAQQPNLSRVHQREADGVAQEQSFCLESPTKGLGHSSVSEKPAEHA